MNNTASSPSIIITFLFIMVNIKEIRASNTDISIQGLTALFVGATQGIGASTLKQLATHTQSPNVYIVGRSKAKAAPLLAELRSLNVKGSFTFIEAEVSLVKDVDRVCDEIKSKEQKLDLLWLSPGLLTTSGPSSAHLEFPSSTQYSRSQA
jgi:short-subunit dehydrogenase